MRRALVVAVAVVFVLAGCGGAGDASGPTTTTAAPDASATPGDGTTAPATTAPPADSPSSTATDSPSNGETDGGIQVMNGDLPYDPNVTFARVQTLLGTNLTPPASVMVLSGMDAAGRASYSTGRVYVDTTDEAVLAHEFAHHVLFRSYDLPSTGSPDSVFARNSLLEGAAEYVEAAYERRYIDRPPSYFRRLPRAPGDAYYLGRYYFGFRYVAARVDSTSGVPALHESPPQSSEQVMHGLAPAEESVRNLTVRVHDRHLASDAEWRYGGKRRLGEITAFLTLRTRLSDDDAVAGADGWGNDRLVTLQGDDGTGFVWVLRWDDPANATEFESTVREYVDADARAFPAPTDRRRTPDRAFTARVWGVTDATFAVRRVAPETTALVVGPESFVAGATVSGGNASTTVLVE